MDLTHWPYIIHDVSTYPKGVKDPTESVLANSGFAATYDLAQKLNPGDWVLEIGCGHYSFLRDNFPQGSHWEGIDVYEIDHRGRKCVASRKGSVDAIPFENEKFNYVLANQSIEHWYEYGVKMEDGLKEICRVLKQGGELFVNFPFHLHGHPWFVTGNLPAILGLFNKKCWKISEIAAFKDSAEKNYPRWKERFPTWYVRRFNPVATSYVINIIAIKKSNEFDSHPKDPENRTLILPKKQSKYRRYSVYGFRVVLWKTKNKIGKHLLKKLHRYRSDVHFLKK